MDDISMAGEGSPSFGQMPPAPGEGIFGAPPYPGAAPTLDGLPSAPSPEHRSLAPAGSAPETVSYQGGGIFADQTPGSADASQKKGGAPQPVGYDYGPSAASSQPPMVAPPMAAPQMPDIGPPPMHGGVLGQEPESSHNLGASLIMVALGAAGGAYYGGAYGALAGGLFGGAAVNAYRAFGAVQVGASETDREAAVSGTYAVGAGVLGAVLWAKMVQPRKAMTPNSKSSKSGPIDFDEYMANRDDCEIRKVGP